MQIEKFQFTYQVFDSAEELTTEDNLLLQQAYEATEKAYVPYSGFRVGAAALLSDGSVYSSANQENASYPVTICAERTLLSTLSSVKPNTTIKTIAISYSDRQQQSTKPLAPCGICRQAMLEYEERNQHKIRIILGGKEGKIIVLDGCEALLPFSFSGEDLG